MGDVAAHYSLSCMYRDGQGVEKDIGGRKYTTWKRLLLVVIPMLDTILDVLRKEVAILRGLRDIGSSLQNRDMMFRSNLFWRCLSGDLSKRRFLLLPTRPL